MKWRPFALPCAFFFDGREAPGFAELRDGFERLPTNGRFTMVLRAISRVGQLAVCAAMLPAFMGEVFAQRPLLGSAVVATETADVPDLSSASLFAVVRGLALPANLVAPANYQDLLHRLWVRSATFRRQCARIEAAAAWRVEVIPAQAVKPGTRADTRITLKGSGGVASVNLMPRVDLVELIGHEMEHVIEQLDGVDLPRSAERHLDGVEVFNDADYETARAIAVGRLVAREFQSH